MKSMPPPLPLLPGDQLLHHGSRADFILRPMTAASGKTIVREVCLHPGAVIILAVAGDGRIVMIRNRRHTVHETLLELPAGTLERDAAGKTEDPTGCAGRELTEETGYVAGQVTPFGWFYTSPGILTEKMYAFIATDIRPGPQQLEETEQIQVELMQPEEILGLIRENRIVDAKSIATLLKYLVGSPRTPTSP
jgi:ADP-ribose pyrophosphatase